MIRRRGQVAAVLMMLFALAWYGAAHFVCVFGGPAPFVADVSWWAAFFCPAWALMLPRPTARLWWSIAGACVFWLAEVMRAAVAIHLGGAGGFWPMGWSAVWWAVAVLLLLYPMACYVAARASDRQDRAVARWRGHMAVPLILLFIGAWYTHSEVWWALVFCPAWALMLPHADHRPWWPLAGAGAFAVALLAKGEARSSWDGVLVCAVLLAVVLYPLTYWVALQLVKAGADGTRWRREEPLCE